MFSLTNRNGYGSREFFSTGKRRPSKNPSVVSRDWESRAKILPASKTPNVDPITVPSGREKSGFALTKRPSVLLMARRKPVGMGEVVVIVTVVA